MRTWHKVASAAGALVVAVTAYGALDAYDVVPGVLTRAPETASSPAPQHSGPHPEVRTLPSAPTAPDALRTPVGKRPSAARVRAAIATALKNKNLPEHVAVTVRDATTGTHLLDHHSDKTVTPASVTKLLSAWVIAHTMDLSDPLTTTVVQGKAGHVVLVAGGDTVLAPGKGDPDAVAGHAGVADLAAQVARAAKAKGVTKVVVDYDASYAPGPLTPPGWTREFLEMGYTARVAQMGLSTQRSDPPEPAVASPDREVQKALVQQLAKHGITARTGTKVTAAKGATKLGSVESAPLIDVLGLALQDSDNAMIESLTRQAAFRDGVPGTNKRVTSWVVHRLRKAGFDMTGVHLADTSGLSDGTTIPTRVLADLIASGVGGDDKPFARVVSRLAVGGLNGTLHDRFLQPSNHGAAGLVRAKTGSLNKVSSLAGTVLDEDGRLLVFAIVANGRQPDGPWSTRAAIDDIVDDLAGCGCTAHGGDRGHAP